MEIKAGLQTKIIGRDIKYYTDISSTNEEARRLAEDGAKEGLIVTAETQNKGRGRRSRKWLSPKGGMWLTIVLRPNIAPRLAPLLTLLTGIVVARAIRSEFKLKATLKWPNDVRINGKKVCGILTELSSENEIVNYILIGLGINVNVSLHDFPKDLRNQITSLQEVLEHEVDKISFTRKILEGFEEEYLLFCRLEKKGITELIKNWRQLSDTLGRNIKIETITETLTGLAVDIAEDGALLVRTKIGEEHKILAGDCIYLDQ